MTVPLTAPATGRASTDPALARICRPGPQADRPAPRTIRDEHGAFRWRLGRMQWAEEPRCERCGAPYDPSFLFDRWCRGGCERGAANRKLLVLGCSRTKVASRVPLPAWQIYDGNLFRICKAVLARDAWPADVGVRILSAEHGLIRPDTLIVPYDRVMTRDRALQLRGWASDVALAVFEEEAGEAYLALGATYRLAVDKLFPRGVRVTSGGGEIGMMQSALKRWLGGEPSHPDLFAGMDGVGLQALR